MKWQSKGDWIGTEDGETVAYIDSHRNRRHWTAQEKAFFAALIAAAPEMYELLKEQQELIEEYVELDAIDDPTPQQLAELANIVRRGRDASARRKELVKRIAKTK